MKNNISKFKDCYGCGVCVKACPVKIISLRENEEGFYQPYINDESKCIECGLCLKTCAFNHDEVVKSEFEPTAYAAWSNNEFVRARCSSGGIGFEIGKRLIENGFKAIGVKYSPEVNRAEHFVAETIEEFMPSVGSKYIPSNTQNVLKEINPKEKYFITGTPCQVDSFRRYIKNIKKEDNFVLLDFFCHGVPSLLLWDKYVEDIKKSIGNITFVSWRNKSTGWQDSWAMQADNDEECLKRNVSYDLSREERKHSYSSRRSEGDLFYKFFLDNYCLNKCCYSTCKYKMYSSAADIRIGDLWGQSFADNDEGVSAVLALTSKGKEILEQHGASWTLKPLDFKVVIQGQMHENAKKPIIRDRIIAQLKSDATLHQIEQDVIRPYRRRFLLGRIANRVLKLCNLRPYFRTR